MTTKINITGSVLFKQVASVIGKVNALEELCKAYRERRKGKYFDTKEDLLGAFEWRSTPQGHTFWRLIDEGKYPYA